MIVTKSIRLARIQRAKLVENLAVEVLGKADIEADAGQEVVVASVGDGLSRVRQVTVVVVGRAHLDEVAVADLLPHIGGDARQKVIVPAVNRGQIPPVAGEGDSGLIQGTICGVEGEYGFDGARTILELAHLAAQRKAYDHPLGKLVAGAGEELLVVLASIARIKGAQGHASAHVQERGRLEVEPVVVAPVGVTGEVFDFIVDARAAQVEFGGGLFAELVTGHQGSRNRLLLAAPSGFNDRGVFQAVALVDTQNCFGKGPKGVETAQLIDGIVFAVVGEPVELGTVIEHQHFTRPSLLGPGDEGAGRQVHDVVTQQPVFGHRAPVARHHPHGRLHRPDEVGLGILGGDENIIIIHHPDGKPGIEVEGAEAQIRQTQRECRLGRVRRRFRRWRRGWRRAGGRVRSVRLDDGLTEYRQW